VSSIIITTYTLPGYGGALWNFWLPSGKRYLKIPMVPFAPASGGWVPTGPMGSFKMEVLVQPEPIRASVILFQGPPAGGWIPVPAIPYQGGFQAWGTVGQGLAVPSVPFTASSMLGVVHGPHDFLPLHLAERFKKQATQMVDQAIEDLKNQHGDFADRRDDILFGWVPFPPQAPDQVFIRLMVPLTAKIPVAPDLDCSISYWITLTIDGDGRLGAGVWAVETWVEGGLFSGSVSWRLKAAALQAVDTLNAQLAAGLDDLNNHRWLDWYLMPGKLPLHTPYYPKDYSGDTEGEVTVALVQ
jgi:hypothetical protein